MNVRRLRPSSTRRSAVLWARAGIAGAGVAAIAAGAVLGAGGHAHVASAPGGAKPAHPAMRLAAATQNQYWMVASDGGLFPFGGAASLGSEGGTHLNKPIVGMAATPSGRGYWMVASDGGMFPFGDAGGYGSTGNIRLNQPIVGMATTPDGKGYWLVASDGGIFPFGDAAQGLGSTGNIHLNKPIVGMASTPSGRGYWLVASDGGMFPFGDAGGYGSTGAMVLNQPIVGMAPTPDGKGYWLVASDGGMFPFGDAGGFGSTGAMRLNSPIVGMAATQTGRGYWLVASDGGLFPFGDAVGSGSEGGTHLNAPIVAMAASPTLFPSAISIPTPASLPADGTSTESLTATVTDAGGLRVPGVNVLFQSTTAGCGSFNPTTGVTDLSGHVTSRYTASHSIASCGITVRQAYGAVSTSSTLVQHGGSPASITASPGTSSWTADQGNTGIPTTFTVRDSLGNGLSGVQVDLAPGNTLTGATGYAASAVTGSNGSVTVPLVDTTAGDSGSITGTVHGTAISQTTGTISIIAGNVHTITVTGPGTAQTAGSSYSALVQVSDAYNNPINPATNQVTFGGAAVGTAPDGTHTGSGSFASAFSSGQDTATILSYTEGTSLPLTVSFGGVTGSTTVTVNAASAHAVTATPSTASNPTADQGNTGVPLTFTVTDLYGNAVSGVSLTLSTTLGHASFTPVSPITTADGTNGTTLGVATTALKDTHAGDAGTVTATVTGSSPAIAGSTATVTIAPGALASLAFSTIGTQVAGTQYTPTLTAADAYNNPVNPAGSAIVFTGTALDTAPDGTSTGTAALAGAFSGGQATVNVTSYKAESATLTATDGAVSTGASSFTVGPAVPSTITPTPSTVQSVSADTGSVPVSFSGVDLYNNVASGYVYDLTTSLSHATLPAGNQITANGSGVASFVLTDTTVDSGTVTATVHSTTASASTAQIQITAGKLSTFSWSSSPSSITAIGTQKAGTAFTAYLDAFDAHANSVNPPTGDITLGGAVKDQAPDGVHTGTVAFNGPFSNGQAAVNVTAYKAEASSLTAGDTTNTAGGTPVTSTSSFTVSPNTYAQLAGTSTSFKPVDIGIGTTVNGLFFQDPASNATATVTLTAEDLYANKETTITDPVTVTLAKDNGGATSDGGTLSSGLITSLPDTTTSVTLPVVLSAGTVDFNYNVPASFTASSANGQITFADTNATNNQNLTYTPGTTEVTLTKVHTVTVGVSSTSLTADTAASPGLTVSGTAIDGSSNQLPGVRVLFSSTGTLQGTTMSGHADTPTPTAGAASFVMHPTTVSGTSTTGNAVATLYGAPTDNVNLSATSQQVTVTPGAFAQLSIGTLAATQTAGSQYTAQVLAKDAENNAVNPATAATPSGTALDTAPDNSHTGTASLGAFSNGAATLTGTAYKAETGATLSLTIGSVTSNTKTFDVTNAAAASVTAASLPANCCTADTGNSGIGISYTVRDTYQNLVPSQNLSLSTGLINAKVDTAASPSKANSVAFPVTIQTNTSGVATATVYDTTSGDSGTVTATVPSTAVAGSTGTIAITPGAISSLTLSQPTNQTAGTLYKVTVHAADAFSNATNPALSTLTCNSTPSPLTCSGKALDTAPDGSSAGTAVFESQFSGGQAILDVTSYKSESGVALSLADTSPSVTAPAMTTYIVSPAAASQFLVNSNSTHYNGSTHTLTIAGNGETDTFSLTMADPYQNVANTHLTDVIHVSMLGTDGGTLTGGGHTSAPDTPTVPATVDVTLSGGSQTFTYTAATPVVPLQTGTISFSDTTSNAITPNPSTVTVKT